MPIGGKNDESSGVSVERADRVGAVREMEAFIIQNPNILGGADIYNLDFGTPIARAAMLAAVLTDLVDNEMHPMVNRFVFLVPPNTDLNIAAESAWLQFVESFEVLAKRQIQPDEIDTLKARLIIVAAADRRHISLLDIIAVQDNRVAVIVLEAAGYRNETIEPYVAEGAGSPLQPEDVWVPQLNQLATAATRLAGEKQIYVALDSDEPSPRRQVLFDLLLTIEGCGVMGSHSSDDPETILASRVDQWEAWIRLGKLGQALKDVDSLPPSMDQQKAYLRIQLLYRGGHLDLALGAIRKELGLNPKLNAKMRVKLARIAQDANASRLAGELLTPAIKELDGCEDLESAMATAQDARLIDAESTIALRLQSLFPTSARLWHRQLKQLARDRRYADAASLAREELGDEHAASFYDAIARHLSSEGVPDYQALIAEAGRDHELAAAYRMASVSDALSRKLLMHALDLVMPLPSAEKQSKHGERLLLSTLEALLLASKKGEDSPILSERFQIAVLALVERLAADTSNQILRMELAELMQPAIAGAAGLALMAMLVLKLASRPIELRKSASPGQSNMAWLMERKPFLEAAFRWMEDEAPVVIGRAVLPMALLTEPADEVVSAVADYLAAASPDEIEDTNSMLTWLAFGASVVPHSSDPDFDLRLIRLVAGKLASAGNVQQARDLVEQALINSTASARRRRLAWFAMADVYTRGGNFIEGLLAIACTLAADNCCDEEEYYQEITGVARLLRDCGLHDQARIAIRRARSLLERMGMFDRYQHQLETLELQLRVMALPNAGDEDEALKMLLKDVTGHGREVLRHRLLTAPAAALLGQLLRKAHLRGLAAPPEAQETFDELLHKAGGPFSRLVATMSLDQPTAEDLLASMKALGPARYSDDVGFDMRNLVIAASRALAGEELLTDSEGTAFVLDLLADRGVALPGWDEAPVPPPAPETIGETAEIARAVSRTGLSLVQAGFDENGRLVRLSTVGGKLGNPTREPADIILEERMRLWGNKFPYDYGVDETTANLFYTTTANLRLSELPDGPVVVAADASLQAFPPNLFFIDGDFAGRTRPMAATPSLAWLGRAHSNSFAGDGRMCAWISTAEGGGNQTLPMIAERLQPTFEQFSFSVDNGPLLPRTFAGATLAVVTAHGGVQSEGRYFKVVSDESALCVSAADLANALRNIGVVVLFVCSGGRADKHPVANTILGLAKQIVDRGCSAVIASPWPLDARVPSHWLPAFLEHWAAGTTLIEANFQANKVVDHQFALNPAHGLAMTVFGNPGLVIASKA